MADALRAAHQGLEVEFVFRESLGDKNLHDPLWKMPEKGVFTEDFRDDLLSERVDLVVHSWKDLPTERAPGTRIAATLPRADQRDLLLVKNGRRPDFRVLSSSPRRAHNLSSFLREALPWRIDSVEFLPVRGNVQTRVKKFLDDQSVDGLVVAKAAMDRLLSAPEAEIAGTRDFLRKAVTNCRFMVLPLSVNPNAAAQGALAVEVKNERQDVLHLLEKIHCARTFRAAERERELLSGWGGGCHQKIGVAVLPRPWGNAVLARGVTERGENIHLHSVEDRPRMPSPSQAVYSTSELRGFFRREFCPVTISPGTQGLFVAKAEAWPEGLEFAGPVWAAGVLTWKALAKRGVWVNGCQDGLGEHEPMELGALLGDEFLWKKLTHADAPESEGMEKLASYRLVRVGKLPDLTPYRSFFWSSGSHFLVAIEEYPEVLKAQHSCGPGHTFEVLSRVLGERGYPPPAVFLDSNDWRKNALG